mmetsp:Transcript_85290/g.169198  ORF Transcript_85290/g.169198 Transcript_85290/m.169198 type:complete len:218 (+) Transcript_85290:432-1085(+)
MLSTHAPAPCRDWRYYFDACQNQMNGCCAWLETSMMQLPSLLQLLACLQRPLIPACRSHEPSHPGSAPKTVDLPMMLPLMPRLVGSPRAAKARIQDHPLGSKTVVQLFALGNEGNHNSWPLGSWPVVQVLVVDDAAHEDSWPVNSEDAEILCAATESPAPLARRWHTSVHKVLRTLAVQPSTPHHAASRVSTSLRVVALCCQSQSGSTWTGCSTAGE